VGNRHENLTTFRLVVLVTSPVLTCQAYYTNTTTKNLVQKLIRKRRNREQRCDLSHFDHSMDQKIICTQYKFSNAVYNFGVYIQRALRRGSQITI
jgi:hypothetical protein